MDWRIQPARFRVAVLAGGDSAEREVSLRSGACVAAALRGAGDIVELFDTAGIDLAQVPWKHFDACLIALHGGAGEDGRLQRRLDLLKVRYTGSDMSACRLAMSKTASKERFLQAGVATPPYALFQVDESCQQVAAKVRPLGFPLVIKPDSQGSSLGVSIATGAEDLERCLAECRRYDDYAIAEPLVEGRELTVSILGRRALPVLEIVPPTQLFDYQAKYNNPRTEYRFETGLPPALLERVQQVAVRAAHALGTRGLVRVDLKLDRQRQPWVLELNTVPGLTDSSLAPKAAKRGGLDMGQLCRWMIRDCLGVEVAS